jgi:Cu+-exporting ATPase
MDEALKKRGEALLERDMALEQPLEQIDQLNPYDMLNFPQESEEEKFVSLLSGDTIGVADGDLKVLAEKIPASSGEAPTAEVVKTYIPSKAQSAPEQKTEPKAEPISAGHLSEKARRSNTALVESLNKALKEKRESDLSAYRTLSTEAVKGEEKPGGVSPLTHGLNIDYKKQILTDTSLSLSETHPQLIEQKMNELKGKRKRKIRDFVLEDIVEEEKNYYDDSDDENDGEFDNYDTSGQIWSDLCETHKGLRIRFFILFVLTAFAGVVAVGNDLRIMNANVLGINMYFLDVVHDTAGFLYLNLILGILGILTCSSVITRGFGKLFSGKADCDSLCAVPAVASVLCVVPMLSANRELVSERANIFVFAALAGLLFNTIGKLMMMARAKRNFSFVSGDSQKHYAEIIEDENVARAFTKGVMYDLPILCTMRKTEFLTDFLKNSYCNDKADQLCRYIVPTALAAALAIGLGALFIPYENTELTNNIFWALTAANATLCALSPLSMMFLVNNPLLRASKSLAKNDAVVLGYNSAEHFSKVNSVLVDASLLFPAGSVDFRNLKRCQQPNSLTGFAIDEAIITAASLAIKSGSILTSMFYDMLAGKSELLYDIDNCIYEVNMGISGWLGNKRLMLGNRDQMKHHGIRVPDIKKEQKYSDKFGDVVYLASKGETIAMFFLKIVPNPQIKASIQALQKQGVSIVVRSRDSLITDKSLAEAFDLNPEHLKVIPYDLHTVFDDCTRYASRGSGDVACAGRFTSFASALSTAKKVMHSIILSSSALFSGLFFGIVLSVIFTLFFTVIESTNTNMFSSTNIILFNLFFFGAMMLMQGVKKY